jgi:hypothetical protein
VSVAAPPESDFKHDLRREFAVPQCLMSEATAPLPAQGTRSQLDRLGGRRATGRARYTARAASQNLDRLVAAGINDSRLFTTLWEHGRLDPTVEGHVLKIEFAPLFTDADRDQARDRLEAYGWRPLR